MTVKNFSFDSKKNLDRFGLKFWETIFLSSNHKLTLSDTVIRTQDFQKIDCFLFQFRNIHLFKLKHTKFYVDLKNSMEVTRKFVKTAWKV